MFTVEIAGVPIAIDNNTGLVERLCRDYISDKEPAFTVLATIEEVKKEKEIDPEVSLARAEQLCIHRKISLGLIDYDAFVMHAAVVDVDGRGVAFAAKSGTGKTTRIRLWQKAMGDRVKVVNGDKPILRFVDGQLYAYGTPWMGKEGWGSNTRVPLNYVCFLERAEEVSLTRLKGADALPRVFRQILMPGNVVQVDRFMDLLDRFAREVSFYLLKCNWEKEDPEAIWNEMKAAGTSEGE